MRQDNRAGQGRASGGTLGLALACVLALAAPAAAQQRYDLADEGWVRQTPPQPGTPEAELAAIKALIAQGEGKRAKHAADDWIEANEGHELMPEAILTRGDANVTREHFFKSLFDYEKVIREYPGSEQFHTAMEREFELAKLFMAGTKRRLWGMRLLGATEEAQEILVRIQERSPGSELGELASITLADYYFNKPQMDSAADAYDLFLVNYPNSERREWAMIRLIQANLARFKGPRFDATGLIDAGQRLKTFRAEYPASAERMGVGALLIRIDESLAMRDMIAAGWHLKRKQPLSAIYLYQRVILDYPETAAAQDAIRALDRLGAEPLPVEEVDATPTQEVMTIPLPVREDAEPDPAPEPEAPPAPDAEPQPQPGEDEDAPDEAAEEDEAIKRGLRDVERAIQSPPTDPTPEPDPTETLPEKP